MVLDQAVPHTCAALRETLLFAVAHANFPPKYTHTNHLKSGYHCMYSCRFMF